MTGTTSGWICAKLRAEIVAATLPPGARLRIDELCARYLVTSTPVREALNKLTSEHLVVRHEQRGFRIPMASLADLDELTRTRCWVEAIALRESMAHGTEAWRVRLHESLEELTTTERSTDWATTNWATFRENPGWEGSHRAFHLALIGSCPSRRMIDFCAQLADQAAVACRLAMAVVHPRRNVSDEHRRIADAALGEDGVAALLHHFRRTADIVAGSGLGGPEEEEASCA